MERPATNDSGDPGSQRLQEKLSVLSGTRFLSIK